jgi:hypothetical protein
MKTMFRFSFLVLLLVSVSVVNAQHQAAKCSKWRADVKTLTDENAVNLLTQTPGMTTLEELGAVIPPKILHADKTDGAMPRYPNENKVVEVTVMITSIKIGADDGDMEFVMKSPDSDLTMMGEIPDPGCQAFDKFTQLREQFKTSRQQGKAVWDLLKKTRKPVKVKVTGVPFWDAYREDLPKGANKYFREIHPILKIEVL